MGNSLVPIFLWIYQAFLMILIGVYLFKLKSSLKKILVVSCIFAFVILCVRSTYLYFHIPFGTHTIILASLFLILFKYFFKVSWGYSTCVTLIDFILIVLAAELFGGQILNNLKIGMNQLANNLYLLTLMGILENSLMLLLTIILKIKMMRDNKKTQVV